MTKRKNPFRAFPLHPIPYDGTGDAWEENEEDLGDWWNYEENEPNEKSEEEMEYA